MFVKAILALLAGIFASLFPAASPAAEPPPATPEIALYAATSLRDALQAMATACEKAEGVKLVFNFGASNDLARQIEAANKADIFFSADEAWMDKLASAGLVDAQSRRTLLSNRLAVIGRADSSFTVASASDLGKASAEFISIANPEAVPVGKYTKAWLEQQGAWESVRPRVLPGVDVRAALAAVAAGQADLGVVYATDAAISSKVKVLYLVPDDEGPRIRYPVAALQRRPSLEKARAVVAWLAGPEAGAVFKRFGFIVLP